MSERGRGSIIPQVGDAPPEIGRETELAPDDSAPSMREDMEPPRLRRRTEQGSMVGDHQRQEMEEFRGEMIRRNQELTDMLQAHMVVQTHMLVAHFTSVRSITDVTVQRETRSREDRNARERRRVRAASASGFGNRVSQGSTFRPPQRSFQRPHLLQRQSSSYREGMRPPVPAGSRGLARPAVPRQDVPSCERCGRRHPGECRLGTGACLRCGQFGHYVRECPVRPAQTVGRTACQPSIQTGRGAGRVRSTAPIRTDSQASADRESGRVVAVNPQQARGVHDTVIGKVSIMTWMFM